MVLICVFCFGIRLRDEDYSYYTQLYQNISINTVKYNRELGFSRTPILNFMIGVLMTSKCEIFSTSGLLHYSKC